jgi:hypothetical protein
VSLLEDYNNLHYTLRPAAGYAAVSLGLAARPAYCSTQMLIDYGGKVVSLNSSNSAIRITAGPRMGKCIT